MMDSLSNKDVMEKMYGAEYYIMREFGFNDEKRKDHDQILKLLNPGENDRILDIGCGLGVLLARFKSKNKIGIETNNLAVEKCKERGLNVIKLDVENGLPFDDFSFDAIVMNEVLEHLKNPEAVLKECHRILDTEGKMVISTPARNLFFHDLESTHFSEMSVKELRNILKKTGFRVSSHWASGYSFIYAILELFIFKPFRYLRFSIRKKGKQAKAIDYFHKAADNTILKPLSGYRNYLLGLGCNQMVLAVKFNMNAKENTKK